MPIYMKYGTVKGDVTAEGHKGSDGWVEVNSFQWGGRAGDQQPDRGSDDRESSAPSLSEITVTKPMDVSSAPFLNEALVGEGVDCQIDFCKTDKGALEVYATYTLTNTMISGYSTSSGGDRPQESMSLNFTKVEFKLIGMKAAGETGDPYPVGYDIGAAKIV